MDCTIYIEITTVLGRRRFFVFFCNSVILRNTKPASWMETAGCSTYICTLGTAKDQWRLASLACICSSTSAAAYRSLISVIRNARRNEAGAVIAVSTFMVSVPRQGMHQSITDPLITQYAQTPAISYSAAHLADLISWSCRSRFQEKHMPALKPHILNKLDSLRPGRTYWVQFLFRKPTQTIESNP